MSQLRWALKWVTFAWLGVASAVCACCAMFHYEVFEPLAVVLRYGLIPILLPPVLAWHRHYRMHRHLQLPRTALY